MQDFFLKVSITLIPALMAITCHEVAHGFVADRLGDKTARMLGRLTLNPIKHLDIIGTAMIYFVGFGWAKPVPVNPQNLRRPRRDMMWVAAAGPCTNFAIAIVSALALRLFAAVAETSPDGTLLYSFATPVALMFAFSVYINITLGVLNLLPLPPLDGGRILTGVLPQRLALAVDRLEKFGFVIVIALFVLTDFYRIFMLPVVASVVQLLVGEKSNWVFEIMKIIMTKGAAGL